MWYTTQKEHYRFSEKLGGFRFEMLQELSLSRVIELMTEPEPLHRFPAMMSQNFYSAVQSIGRVYNGNAGEIWANKPSSAEVVYRFLQFDGIGRKIATMAANIFAREFKVLFADYYSIDVSVDVQVRRMDNRHVLAHELTITTAYPAPRAALAAGGVACARPVLPRPQRVHNGSRNSGGAASASRHQLRIHGRA